MEGRIFNIQKFSVHDGPGIRTTVFFKGCNLNCLWCHNPESQNMRKEILFYKNKCTGCGRCKDLAVDNQDFVCLNDAKEICGKDYGADEILAEILKDKPYYKNSGGGVTFSGGECMLQIAFLTEILKLCKQNDIHTAVDTAGHVSWDSFEKILPYTDLFLYDLKLIDSQSHKKYTGVDNVVILENLKTLLKTGKPVWVRIPIIPNVNDTKEDMQKVKDFFDKNGYPEKTELLPYHALGDHKYAALGRETNAFAIPDETKMETLRSVFSPN